MRTSLDVVARLDSNPLGGHERPRIPNPGSSKLR